MLERRGAYYYVLDGKWNPMGRDLGEALRQWAEIEGEHLAKGRTVSDAVAYYLVSKPGLAPRTVEGYRISETRLCKAFGTMLLDELRPEHVTRHLRTAEHKIAANRDKALLSAAYRWVNAEGWLKVVGYNPAAVPRNPEKARRRYVTDKELAALLDKATPKLACMIELAYITGMRKGDLLRLRLADAQDDGLHVAQGKTGHRQVFTWTADLRRLVDHAKGLRRKVGSLWLFPAERDAGQAMTALALRTAWERARGRAGLADVRWHDLRRKAGSDAPDAVTLLGHADPRTTRKHYQAAPVPVRPLSRRPLP